MRQKHLSKQAGRKYQLSLLGLWLFASVVQADGAVQGRFIGVQSKQGLEGAMVEIQALGLQTTTDRDGGYRLPAVPAGDYMLQINYLGGEILKREISVADKRTTVENFTLQPLADLEHVLVIGQAASVNKALNKQRAANSIVSIVNADAMGQYPDANTSEALQRLPGVSVENDQGEARYVRIRGLGANFNAVTINGSKVPSPDAGQRAVALDIVPVELLESLEVTKTLTPDMDADSLGGTINVKSLSAFDRDGLFYKVSLESSYDDHSQQSSPKFAVAGSNIFSLGALDNIGVAAALSWFERDFGSDNLETGGAWNFDRPVRLEEFEQRDYRLTRERLGLSVNLDWKLGEHTDIYWRGVYSEYQDTETRLANVVELFQFERDDEGTILQDDEGDPLIADGIPAAESGGAAIARELKYRSETLAISSLVFGGKTNLDSWSIDYQLGLSESSEDTPFNIDTAAFEAQFDEGVSYEAGKIIRPRLPSQAFSAAEYALDEIEMGDSYTEDREANIRIDVVKNLSVKRGSAALKFGSKISRRKKMADENVWQFEELTEQGVDDEQALLSAYTGSEIDYELGVMGDGILRDKVFSLVDRFNRDDFIADVDTAVADYLIREDIDAAYLMATAEVDRWRLLAGLRYESTDFSADGFAYNEYSLGTVDIEEITAQEFSNTYSHTLPSVHVRYAFSDKTFIRAAWSNAVVRPTFEQLSPGKVREDDEVEFGNPLLKPLESANFDVGIEHYAGFASYYSAFLFSKSIDNFVYTIDLGENVDTALVGPGEVSEALTFRNGKEATLYGFELAATQQFSSLPSPWNGLLVSANASWTDSDATIDYFEDGERLERTLSLPSQSDISGNFAIGYETKKVNIRLAFNYKDQYLLEISDPQTDQGDIWVDSQLSIDMLARWNISESFQVFVQGVNLGDEPYYAYVGDRRFNAQYEEYGPTYRIGLSLSHF